MVAAQPNVSGEELLACLYIRPSFAPSVTFDGVMISSDFLPTSEL
jgi:hypothetical protein